MNLQKNIPTLIDVIREKLTQSLPILLESVSKGNSDLPIAERLSQLSHGLKELLNQAGQEVLKAVIESLDSQEERIERNGRTYTLKDEASEKFYFTEFGRVSISRRYYHCHLGDAGIVPLDQLLEMDGQYAMPDVVEKILWLSSEFVPGKIAEVLEKLLLITISPKAIQNIINHRSEGDNKALQEQITFFKNNQSLMNYHEHVANGWPIGSGPVEAGCKTVVKARLCRSGMRWSRDGGRNILALRVLVQSGDWDHAWNHYRTIRRKTAA